MIHLLLIFYLVLQILLNDTFADNQYDHSATKKNIFKLINEEDYEELDKSENLAGEDGNNNNIRDDVENYIKKKFSDPRELTTANLVARYYQYIMTAEEDNKSTIKEIANRKYNIFKCAKRSFSPRKKPSMTYISFRSIIQAISLNTEKRKSKYKSILKILKKTNHRVKYNKKYCE